MNPTVYTTLSCQLSQPCLIDPLKVTVDADFLCIYDAHRTLLQEIPLKNIVQVESGLYKHPLIPNQQFPFVNVVHSKILELSHGKSIQGIQNNSCTS